MMRNRLLIIRWSLVRVQPAPLQAPLVAGMGGAGMAGNETANEVQARTGYPTEAWDTGAQHIRVPQREVG
jgi:hypothetical protein